VELRVVEEDKFVDIEVDKAEIEAFEDDVVVEGKAVVELVVVVSGKVVGLDFTVDVNTVVGVCVVDAEI
jgi:hypothetical protein